MDPIDHPQRETTRETLEPMDGWLHLQPSMQEEKKGRIYLPASVEGARILRGIVMAVGNDISDLSPGDIVLVLSGKSIDLRDGSQLVRREHVVARLNTP